MQTQPIRSPQLSYCWRHLVGVCGTITVGISGNISLGCPCLWECHRNIPFWRTAFKPTMIRFVLLMMLAVGSQAELDITSSLIAWTWEVLLERVDRYILPLMPFWYEDLDPHFTEAMLTAHHMGEHNVLKSYMNNILNKWKKEV